MNAQQVADEFFYTTFGNPGDKSIEELRALTPAIVKGKLTELLLTVWNQSAAKHNRASDTWYEEEENQYGVALVPVEFSVTLPPTDTDSNQTLPSGDKIK